LLREIGSPDIDLRTNQINKDVVLKRPEENSGERLIPTMSIISTSSKTKQFEKPTIRHEKCRIT
jgi:hypothetical protein